MAHRRRKDADTRKRRLATRPGGQRPGQVLAALVLAALTAVLGYMVGKRRAVPLPAPVARPVAKPRPAPRKLSAEKLPPRRPLPPAAIAAVSSRGEPTEVVVRFAQRVEPTAAQCAANYVIDPGSTVRSAALDQDGKTVVLTTSALEDGVLYTLTVKDVQVHPASPFARQRPTATFRHTTSRRVFAGLAALYTFEEGKGGIANDLSSAEPPLNLSASDLAPIRWVKGGLRIEAPTVLQSAGPARQIIAACRRSNEITVEAWLKPQSTEQDGPARIVTLSYGSGARNFTLGQEGTSYDVRLRTTTTGDNASRPSLASPGGVSTELHHVVYTRARSGQATLYIHGKVAASRVIGGDFSNWEDDFRLGLANEIGDRRPWVGELHLVAVYSRALTSREVTCNYGAGPEGRTPWRSPGRR